MGLRSKNKQSVNSNISFETKRAQLKKEKYSIACKLRPTVKALIYPANFSAPLRPLFAYWIKWRL